MGLEEIPLQKINLIGNRAFMTLYILTIIMVHGSTTYGYKFLEKANCEKVGKELIKVIKRGNFTCKKKHYVIE